MKGRGRCPYKLRADGRPKGTALARVWGPAFGDWGPYWHAADRTRSLRRIVGTRRFKHAVRAAR